MSDGLRFEDERLLATFLELVRIDSPTLEERDHAERCAELLAEAGCDIRFDDSAGLTGSNTGNLIATLAGSAPGVLVLSAHMDCVDPCRGVEPVIVEGVVVSTGDTVLGADDKAGVAAIVEVVRRLSASTRPHPTIRVVLSVAEEVGLIGAKKLGREDVEGDLCLVLDADGRPGGIVVGAPTHYTFRARFEGRASHAGVSPEKGISAIEMAVAAISRMRLGKLDIETTANIGSIEGGSATNVIPANVFMTGECRSRDRAKVDAIRTEMHDAMVSAAEERGGSVKVEWQLEYEGFAHSEDDPSVALLAEACRSIGLEPTTFSTGGGSDANIIAAHGVPTLALSCGMSGVHSTEEQIQVSDLITLARLVEAVAYRMGSGV